MSSSRSFGKISSGRRGIALVSVLVIVVLLTAVILGFLVTSKQEQVSSRSYKASSSARQMADTAVNLVQGQINQATSQGMNYAWASQPGAIRVWNNTGALQQIYKLYSAENLTETDATKMDIANTPVTSTPTGDPAHPDMPTTTWPTSPALWVDLNAPVNDASGASRFPIFDETKAATVDGFSVGPTAASPGTTSPPGATAAQPAPMPVRWLYVLQNGQIIVPDATSTGTVLTFHSASVAPNTKNPIVGRIAFWTDDETCKVNINTAGGDGIGAVTGSTSPPTIDPTPIANATFWDIPHFTSPDDGIPPAGQQSLATSQPVVGEFQRYPGHPATVALHNILNGLGWGLSSPDFYTLLPRYSDLNAVGALGGSQGGTVQADYITSPPQQIPLKASPQNHLYTSVAEMLFKINRTPSVINGDTSTTQQQVETARFFLTAHSRAPEVTLFGQPRVSIWPVIDPSDTMVPKRTRTATDQLLSFCATIPTIGSSTGMPYYFTRIDSTSCSVDINIARNATLLQYLDYFTSSGASGSLAIPGYGGSFDTKYTVAGMRQILTEIFDYIRTINVADSTVAAPLTQDYAQPWVTPYAAFANQPPGMYQVAPSVADSPTPTGGSSKLGWHAQGFGIYPRLSEIGVQFIAMGQGASPTPSPSGTGTPGVSLNSIYGKPPSGLNGDSGPGIFSVGDYGTNPLRSAQNTVLDPNTNPYMTDADWEAQGYGNDPITGLPTAKTIQEVVADVNTIMQDNRPVFDPFQPPAKQHPNPNYHKAWLMPGRPNLVTTGATTTTPVTGRAIQAFLLLSFVNPSQMIIENGATTPGTRRPMVWVRIQGLSAFQVNGHPLGFSNNSTMLFGGIQEGQTGQNQDQFGWDTFSFLTMLSGRHTGSTPPSGGDSWQALNPFYSKIIPLKITSPIDSPQNTMTFTGGPLTITLYDGGGLKSGAYTSSANPPTGLQVIQTYTVNFGNSNLTFTMPTFPPTIADSSPTPWATFNSKDPKPDTLPCPPSPLPIMTESVGISNNPTVPVPYSSPGTPPNPLNNPGDRWYTAFGTPGYPWGNGQPGYNYYWVNSYNLAYILVGDVVQSMVLGNSSSPNNPGPWTDARMLATASVPSAAFTENPLWGQRPFAHNFGLMDAPWYTTDAFDTNPLSPYFLAPNPLTYPDLGILNGKATYWNVQILSSQFFNSLPVVPPTLLNGIPNLASSPSIIANTDWDNGIGFYGDGPWINKADEGSLSTASTTVPYFIYWDSAPATAAFYSPNREVPSPGMFGSLPTGVDPAGSSPTGWRTLLFRPYPDPTSTPSHLGWQSPKDHLLLDLFWMPVAEPYAISEPFSTGGKINLNYQIEPFTYITRSTAVRAVLNSEKLAQISATGSQPPAPLTPNGIAYKKWVATIGSGSGMTTNVRFPLDVNMTLTQFDDKFNGADTSGTNASAPTPDIFHSASQICEMYLVPKGEVSVNGFATNWYNGINYGLIGDNVRERPYTNIYGQITTKSNTYTVYYTVQSLKNAEPATDAAQAQWDETKGAVLGEYRGSTTLERYIDPNQQLPDFAAGPGSATVDGDNSATPNLPSYYKWRVVDNHPFAP